MMGTLQNPKTELESPYSTLLSGVEVAHNAPLLLHKGGFHAPLLLHKGCGDRSCAFRFPLTRSRSLVLSNPVRSLSVSLVLFAVGCLPRKGAGHFGGEKDQVFRGSLKLVSHNDALDALESFELSQGPCNLAM